MIQQRRGSVHHHVIESPYVYVRKLLASVRLYVTQVLK